MEKRKRKHRILNHPILGYFLLAVFVQVFISLGYIIDQPLSGILPGYGSEITLAGNTVQTATGVGTAVAALAAAGLFKLWFRPDFSGCLQKKNLLKGIVMLLPFLVVHYIGSIVSWITVGTGSVLIALLRAFAPGFGEEVAYRGLGVANYMRTIKSERQIKVIFWLSSIVFGLVHLFNALAGGDLVAVLIQAVYAIGVGMLFGAVYLRTGNLWPTILGHLSVDFMEFIRADLYASGGLMTGMGIGDWITIAAAVVAIVCSLLLMRPKHYPEIMEIWSRKWNKDPEAETAEQLPD